ncbi:MAG TPA: MFS transporter [Acetobacteraceae bacterium]|jgi:MHS family proline/betaine transporter-like MFS transporter|nr:MFS transporter [Acetobacteraceae bacterium]
MSQAIGVAPKRSMLPQVAGMIGNVLEWYDFAAYGFLAAIFAANFFPLEDHMLSLLASYGVFAAAFVMRPLGGLVFGHIGDRVGRRRALLISVLAMAVPSFAIGLLPTYAGVGVLAPIMLIVLRMIQGLSVGGELTVSIVYLGERSTARHRGISASLSFVGAVVGTLIGSLLVSALDATLGAEAMRSWGWRLPFVGSAALAALGLALRLTRLQEMAEPLYRIRRAPVIVAITTEWRAMLLAFLISIPSGAAYYVGFIYLVTFAHQYDALPAAQANLVVTGGLVTLLFGVPLAAALSDRVGRKPVMLAGVIGQLLLAWPLFAIATNHRDWQLRGWEVLFAIAQSMVSGPMPAMLAERFPTAVRCTASSISYNAAMTLLGGTGPMIVVYLIAISGVPTAPSWYVMATSIAAAIGILAARERARTPLI